MNVKMRRLLVLLVLIGLLVLPVAQAGAKTVKTPFTGTEILVEDISPGRESFPDKNLYQIRDAVSLFEVTASDPRVSGEDLVKINANFKLVDPPVFVHGPMWGEFTISNPDGYWQGTWTGVRAKNGFSYIRFVGDGHGAYKGMQIHIRFERLTPDPTQPETMSGYIIERIE
ncbi:MAG TPA: hypothetical protein VI776_17795 [Anaerolineales bacterium]|nr:hypothetical protein [Anaerolineales bacterium]